MNVERRTWDKEAFEARARSRAAAAAANIAAGSNESTTTAAAAAGHRVAASGDYAENGIGNASNNNSIIKNQLLSTTEDQKEEFLPAQQGRAGPMGSQRAYLKSRSNKVDLESKLGSTEIIDPAAASATRSKTLVEPEDDVIKKGGIGGGGSAITHSSGVSKCADGVGWHCRVCDCFLKDSLTYLDHINGKKHQRYLGYTMRVEKSTTEEVSGLLKSLAEKKQGGNNNHDRSGGGGGDDDALDFEDVVRKKDEEALRRKDERAKRRLERKRNEKGETINNIVGSGAQIELEEGENRTNDAELGIPPEGIIDNSNEDHVGGEEDAEDEDEVEGIDPSIAAMMGFTGFCGRRK